MYRTDLASISELNHYALSSAWQQFNDSSELWEGMGILWHRDVEADFEVFYSRESMFSKCSLVKQYQNLRKLWSYKKYVVWSRQLLKHFAAKSVTSVESLQSIDTLTGEMLSKSAFVNFDMQIWHVSLHYWPIAKHLDSADLWGTGESKMELLELISCKEMGVVYIRGQLHVIICRVYRCTLALTDCVALWVT